ncbi:hypothetical protein F183_A11790 [Bryobacterales bacterium F-183]|nr:hypothetical protein F183_A11790 [Bryobacterales bacterium F-183]
MTLGALILASQILAADASHGVPKPVVKTQGFLPFADAPIHYRTSATLADQITVLNRQLEAGQAKLDYEPQNGYLRSVLKLLGVPESSQTLVYSKTSLQFQHITPQSPRALYFNDNVYVGQVRNSKSLELIAFDATQGAVFYVLGEQKQDEPRFERAQLDCVQCHIANATRGIPGVMVRSVVTNAVGYPKGGAPIVTMGHETPYDKRWNGWYVTAKDKPALVETLDTKPFLNPHSDVVAHMVLAHQTQMHNLITETNYRYRIAQHRKEGPDTWQAAAEATLRYLLFTTEAPLPNTFTGDSTFASDFAALGPRDRKGRTLRDFELSKRLFRYPLSYLIYSDAFDAIPAEARNYVLKRLFDVLSGRDQTPDFAVVSLADRRAILEILVDTKPGLPDEWRQFLNQPESARQ